MSLLSVLWVIIIVLKFVGVIAASWWIVILWPIPVVLLIWLVFFIIGGSFALFSTWPRSR